MSDVKTGFRWKCCLIVAVALGCLLLAYCLMNIQPAKESARNMQCKAHCRNIALAFQIYSDQYRSLPPAYTTDENGNPLHSWRVLILPFLERNELYKKIRLDEPWDSEYNRQFHDQMPSLFSCPSFPDSKTSTYTNYLRLVGPGTLTNGPDTLLWDEIDCLDSTILLVESTRPVCWMEPEDLKIETWTADGFSSFHPHTINIAMCDGSVFSVPKETPSPLLDAAARVRRKPEKLTTFPPH